MFKLASLCLNGLPRFRFTLALLFLLLCSTQVTRADEIAVWNFNSSNLAIGHGAGTLTTDFNLANVLYTFAGTTNNARLGDAAGQSITLQGGTGVANNGRNLTFAVNTTGYSGIAFSLAGQGTSTGFNRNQLQYSIDGGTTFTNFGSIFAPGISFGLLTFDLSSIPALNNNPNTVLRLIFDGASSSTGNNRLDNIVVDGTAAAVPEPATIALLGTGLMTLAGSLRRARRKTRVG